MNEAAWPQYSKPARRRYSSRPNAAWSCGPTRAASTSSWLRATTLMESIWIAPRRRRAARRVGKAEPFVPWSRLLPPKNPWAARATRRAWSRLSVSGAGMQQRYRTPATSGARRHRPAVGFARLPAPHGGLVEEPGDGAAVRFDGGDRAGDGQALVARAGAGDRVGLGFAAGPHQHALDSGERREGEADPVGRRFGCVVDRDDQLVADLDLRMPGEQRQAVAVGTDPEPQHLQAGDAGGGLWQLAQHRLVLAGGRFGADLGAEAEAVLLAEGDVVQQGGGGLAPVGLGVGGRDAALVAHGDPHPAPLHPAAQPVACQLLVGGHRRAAAGENPGAAQVRLAGGLDVGDRGPGAGLGQRHRVRDHLDLAQLRP